MKEYHKIQSVYKRDVDPNSPSKGKFIEGVWTRPEFSFLANNPWLATEKIDGTNIRVQLTPYLQDGKRVYFKKIQGRTDRADLPKHLLEKLSEIFNPLYDTINEVFHYDSQELAPVCLYGEGYGMKIQGGGKYIANDTDFALFDVRVGEWWLKREDVVEIGMKLGLTVAPSLGVMTLIEAIAACKVGFMSQFGNFSAEGMVLTPATPLRARNGSRIITKIKLSDF